LSAAKDVSARASGLPPVRGSFGVIDRKALEEADLAVTVADRPALVADHGVATGQISQKTFEKVLSPSAMTASSANVGTYRGNGISRWVSMFRRRICTWHFCGLSASLRH
jgi:hypothetical protein